MEEIDRRRKACRALLKSEEFRDSDYKKNWRDSQRTEYGVQGKTPEIDHIIDLNSVSICFSEAFGDCSLNDCLQVRTCMVFLILFMTVHCILLD